MDIRWCNVSWRCPGGRLHAILPSDRHGHAAPRLVPLFVFSILCTLSNISIASIGKKVHNTHYLPRHKRRSAQGRGIIRMALLLSRLFCRSLSLLLWLFYYGHENIVSAFVRDPAIAFIFHRNLFSTNTAITRIIVRLKWSNILDIFNFVSFSDIMVRIQNNSRWLHKIIINSCKKKLQVSFNQQYQ